MLGFRKFLLAALLADVFSGATFGAPVPLVNSTDTWHYHRGTNAPQADWRTTADSGLDPTSWSAGQGGFGYATDNAAELVDCRTVLSDMRDRYTTVFLRKSFEVTTTPAPDVHMYLQMDWDDGFVAWLDGNYLTNMVVNSTAPPHTATASGNHESSHGNSSPQPVVVFDFGPAEARLSPGTHTLAVLGLNVSSGSSDFIQVADLFLDVPPEEPTNAISGTIAADTTLFASNSPYAVTGNLTVANNVTLTVEPGTVLVLGSGVNLTVSTTGRLLAEGTADAPIRLERASPAAARWGGITINGAIGSPENRLVHMSIEGNGSRCITVDAGTVYLDHVTFATTDHQYLALDEASFVVTDCYFPGSTSGFEPVHGTLGIKPGGRGIIQNCFFGPITGYNDTIDFTGGNRPAPIIQLINNVFMGTGDDNLDLDSADAWVQGNIFMHVHKNGSPDTSSGVSGGDDYGYTGDATIIGNIFYDCDQAVMAKQGNFYALLNNTIVRQTHQGGLDTEGAILCTQDNSMAEGRGMYLEGNIMFDVEALTRDVVNATVTFQDNLMPLAWSGPGSGNLALDPMLAHVPELAETYFTNWADAQIMKEWLRPSQGSPALGTGPNGLDKGGIIPFGASLSGAPVGTTTNTSATLIVGINRRGGTIPASAWPSGTGYSHYKWRLDTNAWSAEIPITTPINLTDLAPGAHYVEVVGKNDAGFYQDDPAFGSNATVTRSATWSVQPAEANVSIGSVEASSEGIAFRFLGLQGNSYSVQWNTTLDGSLPWQNLTNVPPLSVSGEIPVSDPGMSAPARFYRVVSPAQP